MLAQDLVTCPKCDARYALPAGMLGAGRTLRCGACEASWFAQPPAEPEEDTERLLAAWEEDARREAEDAPAASRAEALEYDARDADDEGGASFEPEVQRRGPPREQRAARWTASFLVGCGAALLIVAMMERESVVRREPDLAGLYAMLGYPVNLAGLEFRSIASRTDYEKGLPVLVVNGEIVNVRSQSVAVPPVSLTARDAAGAPLHTWTIKGGKERAEPGEAVPLHATLASPPAAARDVMLRFAGAKEKRPWPRR